jgi:hypothetical protein
VRFAEVHQEDKPSMDSSNNKEHIYCVFWAAKVIEVGQRQIERKQTGGTFQKNSRENHNFACQINNIPPAIKISEQKLPRTAPYGTKKPKKRQQLERGESGGHN